MMDELSGSGTPLPGDPDETAAAGAGSPAGDDEDAQAAAEEAAAAAEIAAEIAAAERVEAERKRQDLLREVELEATLRFGAREMTLGEVLELGPGDVIELDRQIQDAVDLLVGDKIVARGIAVLTEGKYGLRITEVAEAKKSLESVRCLF